MCYEFRYANGTTRYSFQDGQGVWQASYQNPQHSRKYPLLYAKIIIISLNFFSDAIAHAQLSSGSGSQETLVKVPSSGLGKKVVPVPRLTQQVFENKRNNTALLFRLKEALTIDCVNVRLEANLSENQNKEDLCKDVSSLLLIIDKLAPWTTWLSLALSFSISNIGVHTINNINNISIIGIISIIAWPPKILIRLYNQLSEWCKEYEKLPFKVEKGVVSLMLEPSTTSLQKTPSQLLVPPHKSAQSKLYVMFASSSSLSVLMFFFRDAVGLVSFAHVAVTQGKLNVLDQVISTFHQFFRWSCLWTEFYEQKTSWWPKTSVVCLPKPSNTNKKK